MFERQIKHATEMIDRLKQCQDEGRVNASAGVPVPNEEYTAWYDGTGRLITQAFRHSSAEYRAWQELLSQRSDMLRRWIQTEPDSSPEPPYIAHLQTCIVLLRELEAKLALQAGDSEDHTQESSTAVRVALIGAGATIAAALILLLASSRQDGGTGVDTVVANGGSGNEQMNVSDTDKSRPERDSSIRDSLASDPTESQLARKDAQEPPEQLDEPPNDPKATRGDSVAQDGFSFHSPRCTASGGQTVCTFLLTNVRGNPRQLHVFSRWSWRKDHWSYLADASGNPLFATWASFGGEFFGPPYDDNVRQDFQPGLPTRIAFLFEGEPPQGFEAATLIIVYGWIQNFTMQLRKVVLRDVRVDWE